MWKEKYDLFVVIFRTLTSILELLWSHGINTNVILYLLRFSCFFVDRAGLLDQNIALKTVEYLSLETDYIPWAAAKVQLSYMQRMLSKSGQYGDFQVFANIILICSLFEMILYRWNKNKYVIVYK